MKFLKPQNKIETLLFICAVFIIPIFSILLGSQESILYENLTYLGNQKDYRLFFQLWGILISLDYLISFLYLMHKTKIIGTRLRIIAIFLTIISILSFFIPYNMETNPFLSNVHVYLSLSSSLLTIFMIIYYIHLFQFINFSYYQKGSKIIYSYIIICVFLLLALGDISGILELVMTIFLGLFLYYMICSYDVHKTLR